MKSGTVSKNAKTELVSFDPKPTVPKDKQVEIDQKPRSLASEKYLSLYDRMILDVQRTMLHRQQFEIFEKINNEVVNVTPKIIMAPYDTDGYKKLTTKYANMLVDNDNDSFRSINSSINRVRSTRGVGFRLSMDDVVNGIGSDRTLFTTQRDTVNRGSWNMVNLDSSSSSLSLVAPTAEPIRHPLPFIRVILCKTELVLIYEQHSMTAIKNTEDGFAAEADNKQYDYLTIGRGKIRRRSEGETQTSETLFKSRGINTIQVPTMDTASYVSYFEMYDTYKTLNDMDESEGKENKKLRFPQNKTPEEQFEIIHQLPSFNLASIIMKRVLAGNTFEQGQRRFRNMCKVHRMVEQIDYKYTINRLFTMNPAAKDNIRKAVSDMSFCYTNSDILAISYGIYSYQAAKLPKTGEVCIWSIKNPCDPERSYFYNVPVVSLEFSPYMPTLLAIGLYDGSVEVRDIANYQQPPVAISQRSSSPGVSPVLAIKWIKQSSNTGPNEIDPFLSLSQDGSVTQFRIINSPYLVGFEQIVLERIEGMPEGLPIRYDSGLTQDTNRCSQGLNLTKHPLDPDIYYILTDEGCVHKCSTNCLHNYLEVLKTHDGAVNCMDFSPWSPKVFLTCGNDWCIRIWMEGIFQPLITLKNLFGPYQWACWSRTHSTVLVAINRSQCEIWDLRRSILNPMSSTLFEHSYNTMGSFSRDGFSLAVGNGRGKVFINGLDDMPFPPYYQYDSFEKAIFKAAANYPDLLTELKSVGYFGYPQKGFIIPP